MPLKQPTPKNFPIFPFPIFNPFSFCITLILFCLSTSALAQSVTVAPESVVVYEASDDSNRWQGEAPVESVTLSLDPENVRSSGLTVTLKPGDFDSGNFIRDTNARRTVFETNEYPEITFTAEGIAAEGNSLADGERKAVNLRGDLTMHGVTNEVRLPVSVSRDGATLTATGAFSVLLSDYEMKRPSFLSNTVNDEVTLEFDITLTLADL